MPDERPPFWSLTASQAFERLRADPSGLSAEQAAERLSRFGPNSLSARQEQTALRLFLEQFKSPIILLLLGAAILSFALGDPTDCLIITAIVLVSGCLGFWQERGAAGAVEKLLEMVETRCDVLRGGLKTSVPLDEVVPGDVVLLSAGRAIPGDCLLVDARDLFVNEAALTGESYPVEKRPGPLPAGAPLARRVNSLFMGAHVVSGTGAALVMETGRRTVFGQISDRLRLRPAETEFERGIRRFGYLLMEATMVLVVIIFALNVVFHKPVLDSFLFSLALAVGLTPQLLPAIISINLSHGARRMAREKVIVKRLASIENFGSMDVLCSDKTGTLTDGEARLGGAYDPLGQESREVLAAAAINSTLESGFASPIDEAVKKAADAADMDVSDWVKADEIPYDFLRKRLSVLARREGAWRMVSKGALDKILDVCATARLSDGTVVPLDEAREKVMERFESLSEEGFRVLGVAERELPPDSVLARDDERDMVFTGFLTFWDPPKKGAAEAIAALCGLGVELKIITGDNRLIAAKVAREVGLPGDALLTGPEIAAMRDEALINRVRKARIFAEVEPNQKEDVILALKQAGHVVGFMGDGVNDASAIRAADVGLSVDGAVDAAKRAADIVLLEKDLGVLERGVMAGRKTFSNTLKYVFMATSANFGNMFSMAGASLFLPFLPMLPKQILLTNLLTDMPEMAIAADRVDDEAVMKPRRWDIGFIKRFMLVFGILSSVFDYLTFGALMFVLNASPAAFRTGWFLESVVSATLIVLVIRTRRPFTKSLPGLALVGATIAVIALVHWLPWSPLAPLFGFEPLRGEFLAIMWLIVGLYVASAEYAKRLFYRRLAEPWAKRDHARERRRRGGFLLRW